MSRDGKPQRPTRFETRAAHAGLDPHDPSGAVTPAVHPSTTFLRGGDDGAPVGDHVYARSGNPTRDLLERALIQLEPEAGACAAFASGSAAAAAVLRSCDRGARLLAPRDMYHGLRRLLRAEHERWGLALHWVDTTDLEAVDTALAAGDVGLLWLETPSNPMLEVSDVAALAARAHAHGARVALDATWTPPPLQDGLALGADLVVHATTKYLAGHGDVLGGAVLARSEESPLFPHVRFLQRNEGAVPSPFDAWLTLRGLRTLALRVRAAGENAARVAGFLQGHPAVRSVHWPGLRSHPQHELARRQMHGFGAMLSVRLRGGAAAAAAVAASTRTFLRATSLGGVESLIEHRAPVEGPDTATPDDLLRLSIGVEHPEDLIADLAQALEALT